jgi:hypothetical protein
MPPRPQGHWRQGGPAATPTRGVNPRWVLEVASPHLSQLLMYRFVILVFFQECSKCLSKCLASSGTCRKEHVRVKNLTAVTNFHYTMMALNLNS